MALSFSKAMQIFSLIQDKQRRVYAGDDTHPFVAEYMEQYRTPSGAWPFSHIKPLLTKKFLKVLNRKNPYLAHKYDLLCLSLIKVSKKQLIEGCFDRRIGGVDDLVDFIIRFPSLEFRAYSCHLYINSKQLKLMI